MTTLFAARAVNFIIIQFFGKLLSSLDIFEMALKFELLNGVFMFGLLSIGLLILFSAFILVQIRKTIIGVYLVFQLILWLCEKFNRP